MNAHDIIRYSINLSDQAALGHLSDLTDAELLHRPAPAANHINWQVGHLIAAEHILIEKAFPGKMPPLPAGFLEKYSDQTPKVNDASAFCTKVELLRVREEQRAGTLALLDAQSAADLDRPQEGWTPTVGALFVAVASNHWLMHVGQWTIVRRQLGRPPMF